MPSTRGTSSAIAAVMVIVGAACWLAALSVLAGAASSEKGRALFMQSCQHCHGAKADGQSELAAHLTPPPADLTAKATQSKTDAELRKVILEGRAGTAMSGFEGALNDSQIGDLIAYLRSLTQ